MLNGFKEFILRGNVVDLAVGVVIGAAFTSIVTALTDNFVYPLIAVFGNPEVGGLAFQLRPGNEATTIDIGAIITALINFLLVATVIYFFIVMPMNKFNEAQKRRKGVEEESVDPTETQLLAEIRDLIADSGSGRHAEGAHRSE